MEPESGHCEIRAAWIIFGHARARHVPTGIPAELSSCAARRMWQALRTSGAGIEMVDNNDPAGDGPAGGALGGNGPAGDAPGGNGPGGNGPGGNGPGGNGPGGNGPAGDTPAGKGPGGLGDARNLLGFLVAGFAGAVNLLGLKSAEIGVVLRNESFRVSVIAIFLLAGILAAVASVFVTSGAAHKIYPLVALTVFFFLASLFSLAIWIIPSPLASSAQHAASIWVTVGLWVLAAELLIWALVRRRQMTHRLPDVLNLQSLLLIAAVMLTSTATYGVLRLETISQTSTVAEIGDSLQVSGHDDTLSISVSAAKLSTQEWLGINIMAAPRRWHLASLCLTRKVIAWKEKHAVAVTCSQDPCYYVDNALPRRCTELSEDVIPPDSAGAVQKSIEVPFSPRAFQHVQVTVVTCEPPPINASGPNGQAGSIQPKGTCMPTGGSSRLDIAIPRLR
jgi:hypothetical protein